jgi:hypothetical protein
MRDRQLHAALRAFAEEAAWTLAAETAQGAELPFDILEERTGRGPTLYCYRPDTAGFIADRVPALARLETWAPAAHALSATSGVDGYLRSRGHTRVPDAARERAEVALGALLERLFEDLSEFVLSDERFDRAYAELEERVVAGVRDVEVIVPLLGFELESEELPLGSGLSIVRPEVLERVPEEAVWDGPDEAVLVLMRGDDDAVAAQAAARVRRLVTALRLYDQARVAMGPAAWVRTAGGPWQMAPTGAGGRPEGVLTVAAGQEDELRAFCNLVWRRMPRGGELAWALARFEMGCERPAAHRLTDHLLALRALLSDELLATRVAALCAAPEDRETAACGVEQAVELERSLISGHGANAPAVEAVADVLAGHLRAILRDVLCGHLDTDLRRVADELLAVGTGEEVPVHGDEAVDVMDIALQMGDEDGLVVTEL